MRTAANRCDVAVVSEAPAVGHHVQHSPVNSRCMFLLDRTRRSGCVAVFVESFRVGHHLQPLPQTTTIVNGGGRGGGQHETPEAPPPWKLFLQQVAEAVSRPSLVHEYHITPFSLGTAVTNGWSPDAVVDALTRFAYEAPTDAMAAFVSACMSRYNQASVLLYGQQAFLLVATRSILDELLRDPRVVTLCEQTPPVPPNTVGTVRVVRHRGDVGISQGDDGCAEVAEANDAAAGGASSNNNTIPWAYRIPLQDHAASRMMAELLWTAHGLPICHLYDFVHDTSVRSIELVLRPQCKPRQYQLDAVEAALSEDGTSSRSGVLLLPCGAGKTLVGVLLAAVVKKTTIVICAGSVSVEQWKHQFMEWADLAAPAANDPLMEDDDEAGEDGGERRPDDDEGRGNRGGRGHSRSTRYLSGAVRGRRGGVGGDGPHRAAGPRATLASPSVRQARPIGAARIACLTGKQKDPITDDTDIVITTYTMLGVAHQHFVRQRGHHAGGGGDGRRPPHAARRPVVDDAADRRSSTQAKRHQNPKEALFDRTWGLMVLDEVHMAPAAGFRESIGNVMAKTVVGLTATYVREDHRIRDTFHVVGPKLYDVSWEELWKLGYLASITCVEVHCPMTSDFLMEYTNRLQLLQAQQPHPAAGGGPREDDGDDDHPAATDHPRRGVGALAAAPMLHAIAAANPNKMLCVWELVARHKEQHAKILVFCDQISLLKEYAKLLGAPVVYGETSHRDRLMVFSEFQSTQNVNVICISRVGDVSVNLPCANVVIQVSAHGGSRRQEAQRLGRILRPKVRQQQGRSAEAFFYSIVSRDTMEVYYASHRTEFLVDQGYHCRLVAFEPPTPQPECDGLPSGADPSSRPEPTTATGLSDDTAGDATAIKHEALLADMMQHRRLTVGRAQQLPDNGTSALALGIRAVATRPFQIRLLAAMVSPWEVRYLQADQGRRRRAKRGRGSPDEDDGNGGDEEATDDDGRSSSDNGDNSGDAMGRRPPLAGADRRTPQGLPPRSVPDIKREFPPPPRGTSASLLANPNTSVALAGRTVAADGIVYHEL